MTKLKIVVSCLILVAIIVAVAYKINDSVNVAMEKRTTETQSEAQKTVGLQPTNTTGPLPWWGVVIAFILLGCTLVAVMIWAYSEKKNFGVKEVLLQPVFISIMGIVVLNVFASLYVYEAWLWFWSHKILFWSTNMGIPIFVHFLTKKETCAKVVAVGIAFLIIAGIATTVGKENKNKKNGVVSSRTITNFPNGVPAEIALSIIADCESGNGTPGSGRHRDEEGKVIVGEKNPRDIGKYQINLDHQAALITELKASAYDEEDNKRIARVLYKREGPAPWYLSRGCWEPKLLALGYGREILAVTTHIAPVGKFSEKVPIKEGVYVSWGDSEGAFIIRNQKGLEAKYDPENGILENLPYPSSEIDFKSLGEEAATVRLKFSKTPFR